MSAIEAVHNAIYGALSADATLAALSMTPDSPTVGVVNDEDDGQTYPYVLISRPTETKWYLCGTTGWKVIARVHTYSRYEGDIEAVRINARVVALVDQQLAVTGYTTAIWDVEGSRVMVEDKEKVQTRHAVVDVSVMVRQ